jgi:hypothetical protein
LPQWAEVEQRAGEAAASSAGETIKKVRAAGT